MRLRVTLGAVSREIEWDHGTVEGDSEFVLHLERSAQVMAAQRRQLGIPGRWIESDYLSSEAGFYYLCLEAFDRVEEAD